MINLSLGNSEKKGLTEDEIELAMARKLEILILPILRRNMAFFYAGGNLKGKAKAYNQTMDKDNLIDSIEKKQKSIPAVCKPLCEMVAEILRENNINATTVSCDTDIFGHTDVLITTKSGKQYIINYLEDMELVQTGMQTPDFASKAYYERRYKKLEGGYTTDFKTLESIDFVKEERLKKIDENLGYAKNRDYMNIVIEQIKKEFADFRNIMAENEFIAQGGNEETKRNIIDKYNTMSDTEIIQEKLDFIFKFFNDRMDLNGHADFVMYYSRVLLKQVFSKEEYDKITRYDCFIDTKKIPKDCAIKDVLDTENPDNAKKSRFCILEVDDKIYVFSAKPNAYVKLEREELDKIKEYANVSKSEKPSDLVLNLCDRGNALPLVFHPIGSKILNERAEMISKDLSDEERIKEIKNLSKKIKTTDKPVTSILIPYPDGKNKYLYINPDDEFVVKTDNEETIYHYNEENDSFNEEIIPIDNKEK